MISPTLSLLGCLSFLAGDIQVDLPAPEHGVTEMHRPQAPQEITRQVSTGSAVALKDLAPRDKPTGNKIADLAGRVVLLHPMPEAGTAQSNALMQLVHDALRAHVDGGLIAITLLPSEHPGDLDELAKSLGIEHRLGRVAETGSPYLDTVATGDPRLFVIGRSGQLAWSGDPLKDESEFGKALIQALHGYPAPVYSGDLTGPLESVLPVYYAGDYAKAKKAAQKALRNLERAEESAEKQTSLAALETLIAMVDELERDMRLEAIQSAGNQRPMALFRCQEAAEHGFPRSALEKEVNNLVKTTTRDWQGGGYVDTQRYFAFRKGRPALFPVRHSSRGDAFAKKLEKFLKKSSNEMEVTRLARALLAEYRSSR